MIGTAVRQYRVESKIGAGGMGVVYKAWDQTLDRPAALKVLPPSALENEERRRRFAHEAKVSSGLNHPNIVSIYEVGTEEISGQTSDFIAMELVEGQTLDQVIKQQGLTPDKAISFAIQIAGALAAAHTAGVVHRDLKPSNIMIRPDGTVKILDFGLAKFTAPLDMDPYGDTQSVHMSMTTAGTIVGSVAYMSPEQAEGKDVDARSDIFSLGSVIYEMLAGREAFTGETRISKLTAVIHKQPDPLPESIPAPLRTVVERCHRKPPAERYQSMAELQKALEQARARINSGFSALWHSRRTWIVAAGAFATGLVPAAYFATRRSERTPRYQRLTFRRGDVTGARFAPSQTVYFSAEWQGGERGVFECQPGNRESRALAVPAGKLLSVSGKGELAILTGDAMFGTLVRVQPGGGAPREVLHDVHDAVWGSDNDSFAVVRRLASQFRVEYPVGTVIATAEARVPERIVLSASGLAYFQYDPATNDYDLHFAAQGKPPKTLSKGWRAVGGLISSPDGRELWFAGTRTVGDPALYGVTLNGQERMLLQAPGWLSPQGANDKGMLLATNTHSRLGIRIVSASGSGRDFSWLESSNPREFSRDGKALLFIEVSYGEGRNPAIFYRKLNGSPAVRLGHGNRPTLSKDASLVACIKRDATTQILILPTGAGEQRTIRHAGMEFEYVQWFPDNDRLYVLARRGDEASRGWILPLNGQPPLAVTPPGVRANSLSPDGRFVVSIRDRKISILPIDQSKPREFAKVNSGEVVVGWTPTSDALFLKYTKADSTAIFIDRLEIPTGKRSPFREIPLPEDATQILEPVVLSADGETCAFSYQHDTATLYLIDDVG